MATMKISAIADKFDEKAGTKLPSIKKKIMKRQKRDGGLGGDEGEDDDLASLTSMLSGNRSKKSLGVKSKDITSQVQQEAEKMTRAFNAKKSLDRLTLPTPASVKATEFVKSKCEKFSSYSALEAALQRKEDDGNLGIMRRARSGSWQKQQGGLGNKSGGRR